MLPPEEIDLPVEIVYEGFNGYFPGYNLATDSGIPVDNIPTEPPIIVEENNTTDDTVFSESEIDFEDAYAAIQDIFQGLQDAENIVGNANNGNLDSVNSDIDVNLANEALESDLYGAPFVGIFSIPRVGLAVKCYKSSDQKITDTQNAANYFYTQKHWIVADHNHQDFRLLKACEVGDIAYGPDNTKYKCVEILSEGHNTGTQLTTSDGTSIENMHSGALVAYTCNENWRNVTIVFFQPC